MAHFQGIGSYMWSAGDSETSSVTAPQVGRNGDYRTEQSQKYSPKPRNMFQIVQTIDYSGYRVTKPLAEAHFQISKVALFSEVGSLHMGRREAGAEHSTQ